MSMRIGTVSYNGRGLEHEGDVDMTVHVVAWASSGRGGFDWFYDKENAEGPIATSYSTSGSWRKITGLRTASM